MNIWTFVHQPKEIEKMILNDDLRLKLIGTLENKPNMLLIGSSGTGKGTFVDIFLEKTRLEFIKINGSKENNIETLRGKVESFATSFGGGTLKVVYINEADNLTLATQLALRQLIEDVQDITRFIFTANYKHRIIPEIQSRCQTIEFNKPPATEIFNHCISILEKENVKEVDKKLLVSLIKRFYPDIRKIINTIQLNVKNGKLVRIELIEDVYDKMFDMIKKKDIDSVRKHIKNNPIDYDELYQLLFEKVGEFKSPGDAIIEIGEALYRNSIVAIKEINLMAMLMKMYKNGVI